MVLGNHFFIYVFFWFVVCSGMTFWWFFNWKFHVLSPFGFGRWPPLFVIIRCVLWRSEGGSLVNLYHKSFENSQPSQRMNDTSAMHTSLSRPQQQQKKKENNIVMIRKRTWNFVVINMMFQPSQIFLIMIVMIVVMMQHDVLSEN